MISDITSSETSSLDSVDRKILWELDTNCRITYEKLGQKMNLSANTVKRRLEKLIDDGVIVRFMVLPHNALIDGDFISIIVYTDGTEVREELVQRIGSHPVVHHVSPVVTTEGGKAEVITALKAGVNNYIVKPFTPQVLKEKLGAVMGVAE